MPTGRIAVVTGANKGLGFETCRELLSRGYRVVLTARDPAKGERAVESLKKTGGQIAFQALDTVDPNSIGKACHAILEKWEKVDVLVNNAGIFPDVPEGTFQSKIDTLRLALETNTLGAFQLCQRLLPVMKKQGYGRVVQVSSGMGQLAEMGGGYPAYRLSKTALNAVTCLFAAEMKGTGVLVNSVCPGWVRTDMGGAAASRSLTEGVYGIVWAATLPEDGPTGGFFRDGKAIPW
jgi:NAD(P)-dependent dehydrogenase (short-subunit alcohol dehydrogenase family)